MHVILLCQGSQSRLPDLKGPKQLLPLRACGGVPILYRTLRQLTRLHFPSLHAITIVGEHAKFSAFLASAKVDTNVCVEIVELAHAGNSSLRGLATYLGQCQPSDDGTVVLFGDACYSWLCLTKLFTPLLGRGVAFVGTTDLTPSTGELWGVRWEASFRPRESLTRALDKHPPFREYQPGQMRRWLWECREMGISDGGCGWTAVDDYTEDFDTPDDLKLLDLTSEQARIDDLRMGMEW